MNRRFPSRCQPAHRLGSPLIAVFLLLSTPAVAAIDPIEMPLDELLKVRIVSTPKFADNPDQIPSVVSILTAEDIRLYGWRTLGDALRTLQGFNVTDDATYSYAGVRGISPPGDYRPRLQILIDGMSVNENIYASTPVDSAFPLDIALIERIEVIRGPSASIYGGDAMFGVINIVTRSGQTINGGEASLSFGSGADRRLRATWGGQVGGNDVLISASGFAARGRSLAFNDVTADGSAQNLHRIGGEDGGQLFVKVRGTDWSVSFIHTERDRIVPTASYGTIPDDRGHVESDRYDLLQVAKEWKLDAKNTLHQRLYAGAYAYDGEFPYDYSPADPRLINVDKTRGNWWGIENRLVNTRWAGQRWTLGLEYKANTRQDQMNYDQGYGCYGYSTAPCLDDHQHSDQLTFLAQDEIQLGAASLLTLGLRHDNLGSLGKFWSPRLGFVHDAGQAGLFKILYGTAFRSPTVYERAYRIPTLPYGNPGLSPEKMRSLEFAWEKRFSTQSRLTATVYHFQIAKMVTVDNADTAVNGSPIHANGLELEYEQQWNNGSRLRAGYAVQRAADATRRLDNSPAQMVKLNLAVPTGITHLMAGLEGQWIGARQANFGAERIAPYALANLNLSYTPSGKAWDIALGIYNLFDHRYTDPVAVDNLLPVTRWQMPQLGRSTLLRTTLRF
jgi:iron complex outermembrane receptor protein